MSDVETFTQAERAYFDSRGEKPIPGSESEPEASEEIVAADDAVEDVNEVDEEGDEEPDEQPELKADEEKPKRKDSRIPLRKLQESENQRRELEKQLSEFREKWARGEERLRMIAESQQVQQQPKAVEPPDPSVDPIGAIEWQKQQTEQIRQFQEQQIRQQQEQAVIAQIDNNYKEAWGKFASNTPDAMDAYNHFVNSVSAILDLQGIPQDRINQMVEQEERKIAYQAMQRGISPAEVIYEKSKAMGYQPKAAAPVENETAKKANEDVARRQKAASASKSLSNAGGNRANAMPSMEELANMSEDDFAEFRNKVGEKQFRKLMGE